MDVLNTILGTYAKFFDGAMWVEIFTDPVMWGLIFTLIVMEGLLSADNAIVLAVQVKHLPKDQRKKALMYGLWGAYLFRFIAIGIGVYLVTFWIVKLIGGAYLLWMAIKFFYDMFKKRNQPENDDENTNEEDGDSTKVPLPALAKYVGVFWATVCSVELMDITFSVDSVLAAFGVSDVVGVLLLGGMLGILMMRGIAQFFTKLMDKFPELEVTAYILIAFIGVKMLISIIHIEISNTIFFTFVVGSILLTFLIATLNHKKAAKAETTENN